MGPKLVSKKRRRSHSAMYRLCQHTHQYSDCNGARRATPAKFRRQYGREAPFNSLASQRLIRAKGIKAISTGWQARADFRNGSIASLWERPVDGAKRPFILKQRLAGRFRFPPDSDRRMDMAGGPKRVPTADRRV